MNKDERAAGEETKSREKSWKVGKKWAFTSQVIRLVQRDITVKALIIPDTAVTTPSKTIAHSRFVLGEVCSGGNWRGQLMLSQSQSTCIAESDLDPVGEFSDMISCERDVNSS